MARSHSPHHQGACRPAERPGAWMQGRARREQHAQVSSASSFYNRTIILMPHRWSGIIDGPVRRSAVMSSSPTEPLAQKGTPYEGGQWKIAIDFPIDYPFSALAPASYELRCRCRRTEAPTVKFLTRIYHMCGEQRATLGFGVDPPHRNITDEGLLCIGLLKCARPVCSSRGMPRPAHRAEAWKPSTKIAQIMRALVQLLEEPSRAWTALRVLSSPASDTSPAQPKTPWSRQLPTRIRTTGNDTTARRGPRRSGCVRPAATSSVAHAAVQYATGK
jgi:ubiquitin-protein ligase